MVIKSHIVYLKQKPDSSNLVISNPIGSDPSIAIRKLGGFSRDKDVGRGFTDAEEKKYLPGVIGYQTTDNNWPAAVKNYWSEFNIRVPIEGVRLEVGMTYETESDANAKINGTPINLQDYIAYNFAKKHPRVSPNEEQMYNSPRILFYLFDEAVKKKTDYDFFEAKIKAREMLVKVVADETRKRDLLIVLAQEFQPDTDAVYHDYMDSTTMSLALDKLAEKYPVRFVELANDEKGILVSSFIERCVNKGIFKRVPNTNIIMDSDNNVIGNNKQEAITWLANPANKTEKDMFKARLEQMK